MQAYFDYDDADLEFETLVTRSTSKAGATTDALKSDTAKQRMMGSFAITLVLCGLVYVLTLHLGSASCPEFVMKTKKPETLHANIRNKKADEPEGFTGRG